MLKALLMKAQKEVREHSRKACTVLEKTYIYIIINRVLIEILMLKVLLVRAQKDTRNMLLETRKRKSLLYKGRK